MTSERSILSHIDDGPTEVPASPALPGLAGRDVARPSAPAPDQGAGAGGTLVSLDSRRRPTAWIAGLAAAAAITVVLAAAIVQISNQKTDLEEQIASAATSTTSVPSTLSPSVAELADAALADRSNQVIDLRSDDGLALCRALVGAQHPAPA